jgi:hypothetical protein
LLLALLLKIAAKTVDEINEDKPMNNDISAGHWNAAAGLPQPKNRRSGSRCAAI